MIIPWNRNRDLIPKLENRSMIGMIGNNNNGIEDLILKHFSDETYVGFVFIIICLVQHSICEIKE